MPYSIFRRKHSHAWVEAFIDNRWVIFDPTPPILPQFSVAPSWWNLKWEGVRGRFAYIMHQLKEGGWRRVVDSWQNQSTSLLESPILYTVLVVLVAGFVGRKIRIAYKIRLKNRATVSAKALEWAKRLNAVERTLARLGYRREPGETVGHFAKRIEIVLSQVPAKAIPPKKMQKSKDALAVLKDYELNRWR